MPATGGTSASGKIFLIETDEQEPAIKVKPDYRFEVRSVSIVDPQLNASGKMAARLCGGTTTCLALVEI